MRVLILAAMVMLVMAGCGGGGGSDSPAPGTQTTVQKTSIVDGSWYRSIPNQYGTESLVKSIKFADGKFEETSYLSSSFSTTKGTFTISGNTLIMNTTSWSVGQYGTTIDDIWNNTNPSTAHYETETHTFTLSGNTLTLGQSEIFTK